MEQIKPPVQALDKTQLKEISGGIDFLSGINIATQGDALGKAIVQPIITACANDIEATAEKLRLRNVINTLATYDKESDPMEKRATAFANSWNEHHPQSDPIDANIAALILGLKDYPYARATVAIQPDKSSILNSLNQVYGS